jgi:hypothetical protein
MNVNVSQKTEGSCYLQAYLYMFVPGLSGGGFDTRNTSVEIGSLMV